MLCKPSPPPLVFRIILLFIWYYYYYHYHYKFDPMTDLHSMRPLSRYSTRHPTALRKRESETLFTVKFYPTLQASILWIVINFTNSLIIDSLDNTLKDDMVKEAFLEAATEKKVYYCRQLSLCLLTIFRLPLQLTKINLATGMSSLLMESLFYLLKCPFAVSLY